MTNKLLTTSAMAYTEYYCYCPHCEAENSDLETHTTNELTTGSKIKCCSCKKAFKIGKLLG